MRGAARPPEVVPLRHHRDFRRYWVARQVSIAGTLVTAVALPVLVYRLSGSPSLTALITVVEGVPYLLFGLFSGALSDRLDRRRVMVVADVVAGLTIASVPIAFALGSLTAVHALVAGFLAQTAFVFFDGAAFGALPAIVGRDRIGSANSALWGFGALLDLGVPMLAGVLLAVVHPATLLGIDALSFLLSAACVATIRTRLSAGALGRAAAAAAGAARRGRGRACGSSGGTPGCARRPIVGFLLSLSGAGFMALSVPYADRLLGVGTSGWRFGLVFAAWGVGGVLVAVCTPRLLRYTSPNRLALIWLPVAGVAGVVVALTSTLAGGRGGDGRVGRVLPGRGAQLDDLPPAGHSRAAARPGQHGRADVVVRGRLDLRGAGGERARGARRAARCPGRRGGGRAGGHGVRVALAAAHHRRPRPRRGRSLTSCAGPPIVGEIRRQDDDFTHVPPRALEEEAERVADRVEEHPHVVLRLGVGEDGAAPGGPLARGIEVVDPQVEVLGGRLPLGLGGPHRA